MRTADIIRAGAISLAAVAAATGCAGSAATRGPGDEPSRSASASASALASSSPSTQPQTGPVLVVLGQGSEADAGVWSYVAAAGWTKLAGAPDVTAIAATADGFALASAHDVQTRTLAKPDAAATSLSIKWPAGAAGLEVPTLARSAGGRVAVATGKDTPYVFYTLTASGDATPASGAPGQSFSPSIAWLDETTLLVLSTDNQQVSRIATLNTATGALSALPGLIGVHWFAISGDGATLAAVTEDALYVAPTADWLAGKEPGRVASLDTGRIGWNPALDASGQSMAVFTGKVNDDGTLSDLRDALYRLDAAGWQEVGDPAVPFSRALGQSWIG